MKMFIIWWRAASSPNQESNHSTFSVPIWVYFFPLFSTNRLCILIMIPRFVDPDIFILLTVKFLKSFHVFPVLFQMMKSPIEMSCNNDRWHEINYKRNKQNQTLWYTTFKDFKERQPHYHVEYTSYRPITDVIPVYRSSVDSTWIGDLPRLKVVTWGWYFQPNPV